jgi:hypothetical protein
MNTAAKVVSVLAATTGLVLVMAGLATLAGSVFTNAVDISATSAEVITTLSVTVAVVLSGALAALISGRLPQEFEFGVKTLAIGFGVFFLLLSAGLMISSFTGDEPGLTARQADIETLVGQAVLSILAAAAATTSVVDKNEERSNGDEHA